MPVLSDAVLANIDKILKPTSYDIRAYVGEPGSFFTGNAVLTPEAMKSAGMLMGGLTFTLKNGKECGLKPGDTVVIGYDNGPTSEALANAFAEGLRATGVAVAMIGVASSGQVYQNQEMLEAEGHVQITRSHVEVTTNGAKFGIGQQGIHTYLLGQMNKAAKDGAPLRMADTPAVQTDRRDDGRIRYYAKMRKLYKDYFAARDNSRVAVNLFGGTGVQYATLFREILGEKAGIIGEDLDVNSGLLLADPTRTEMLSKVPGLQKLLDDGFRVHSFDLDADRGSVTEGADALTLHGEGHYLGDALSYILADYKLSIAVPELMKKVEDMGVCGNTREQISRIARTVYIDARYTSGVKSRVDATGGVTVFHPKGHSLWKETITANMNELARLTGCKSVAEFVAKTGYRDYQIEASLHMFGTDAEDGMPRDDAVENIFILEQVFDKMGITSLHEYFAKVPARYITKEIRTTCISNEAKDAITAEVVNSIRADFAGKAGMSVVEFDGQIRVDWADGFVMYGMSNTSPKLTFMAEGVTKELRNESLAYIMALHNEVRKKHGDTLPMDISENSFYIEDESYDMRNPDGIDATDPRVASFRKRLGL